ncbi:hypothetical protein MVI27_09605 [Chryseobacterium salipaludis]|uniref:hypothetical protein n=1 Tax=Chryseobacterium TaxID=59732 RepID=UPI001FF359B4|nr:MULTISPECIES: hypothetical protein [Chryseobacterium]MCJ8498516.1 hypothetical protein [Chryseobacterium salipaludis]MCX3297159.1 hypothetical protein [Planobacterium sp. JC490]
MTQPIISRILLTFICLVTITISGQQQDVCSRFTYTFTYQPDSSDVQSKQLPPLRTRKLLATTRPKFREVEKAYREGTVARIMNGPFGTGVPASRLQQIRERIKKNNNTLERR